MAPNERTMMFHVRMWDNERRRLEALAEDEGISASDYVRMSLRRAFAERCGDKKLKPKRT
jgi:hypothetical protein